MDDSQQLAELADSLAVRMPGIDFRGGCRGLRRDGARGGRGGKDAFSRRRLCAVGDALADERLLRVFHVAGRAEEPVVPARSACGWPGHRPDFSAAWCAAMPPTLEELQQRGSAAAGMRSPGVGGRAHSARTENSSRRSGITKRKRIR